ncbi:histidine kinase [Flavobacterium sp.]|uniref:sensor histidine kinase n=1 Tax=Flavobacterium sp. TaxID=239 RepID=UPI0031D029B4
MNTISNNLIRKNLVFQVSFWLLFFLIGEAKIYAEYRHPVFSMIILYDLCHLIFQIISANFIYFILIKKIFYKKQYFVFVISLIASIYVFSVLNRIFTIYIAEPFFIDDPQDDLIAILTDLSYLFCYYVIPIVTASFVFVSVVFMLDLRHEKQYSTQILKEKAELELKALKTQLNPHFLFNTLNNIYSLSIINSQKTSESISRLSNILDYILYKGQRKLISVSDEMKVIFDYVELEKLRYDSRLELKITEQIQSANLVPPLLFLSLVENAFKHGAASISGNIFISVFVETNAEKSFFRIENSFVPKESHCEKSMGLKIIQDQLKIIYGDRSFCSIKTEASRFIVELTIPANEN